MWVVAMRRPLLWLPTAVLPTPCMPCYSYLWQVVGRKEWRQAHAVLGPSRVLQPHRHGRGLVCHRLHTVWPGCMWQGIAVLSDHS